MPGISIGTVIPDFWPKRVPIWRFVSHCPLLDDATKEMISHIPPMKENLGKVESKTL